MSTFSPFNFEYQRNYSEHVLNVNIMQQRIMPVSCYHKILIAQDAFNGTQHISQLH